ncbi:MAG: PEP-CTERM sorting domain-containing protein [Planctomycetota bacterium]
MRYPCLAAAVVSGLVGAGVSAQDFRFKFQFLGNFTDLVSTNYDAYGAMLTNPTSETIRAFDSIGFGNLLEPGLQNFFGGADLTPPLVADSFFVGGNLAFPGTNVDTGGVLSATSIADLDTVFVPANGSATIAFLAVAPGEVPTFLSGTAFNSVGQAIGLLVPWPEPSSAALLAVGLTVFASRRRAR